MTLPFQIPFPQPSASERLVIFHHAGGSSLSFAKCARPIGLPYEVWLAELPGRATRHAEAPPTSLRDYAHSAARALPKDLPITLYGHSMGAGLAYECAVAAEELALPLKRLLVSCCKPPTAEHGPAWLRARDPATWTEADLLRAMALFGPLPKALEDPEARAYFLSLLHLDFSLVRVYRSEGKILHLPILAFAGDSDLEVPPSSMEGWAAFTRGRFELRTEAGGHFFPLDTPGFLPKTILGA